MPKASRKTDPASKAAGPAKETRVEIKPAKGRPMLTWVGKKPLRHVTAYPAQLVETFSLTPHPSPAGRGAGGAALSLSKREGWPDWPSNLPQAGLLFHGDNKDVLAWLLANGLRGKVKLIYIDPPFDSGADYVRRIKLRGFKTNDILAEPQSLGEQIQYDDIWANDNYLQFMYERILLLKELLSEDGSLFLHCDWHKSHFLRCIMEEVFDSSYFKNEIVWSYRKFARTANQFPQSHDTIFFYAKSSKNIFNPLYVGLSESTLKRWGDKKRGGKDPKVRFITDEESPGAAMPDVWDIPLIIGANPQNTDFPTQKPEAIAERIIEVSSNPGDIVLDCFLGSGTTAVVAQKMGRRWIGVDINKGAIQTTVKRLQGVILEQAEKAKGKTKALPGMETEETPAPVQLGFAVYRVNDYDLQIQHNEAFNLAVEHLGMTRTKTDAFFDGTLGRKLVKIVPFHHPVTALDLEEVKETLAARPEEERDVLVVGLGKELAVATWLEEWNKLRKQGNLPNKVEVIELRTDPKYGGFFTHEPARAKVSFKRTETGVEVIIADFISPTILERLRQQNKDNPLFQPQISDWRAMVDSVMIDADYDGKVFNITLADVPERKNDLVEGRYTVATKKGATVAVKVTDMLGEEVLVTQPV